MRLKLDLGVLCLVLLVAAPVQAQTEPTEEAREHFREGLALADRGDWPNAVEQFEQALALRDAPSIRINLAVSLTHLGRLTEALSHIDRDLSDAPPELLAQAADLRVAIEPRIGRLVVRTREPAEGCEVLAGRRTFALTAEPIPMDPGTVTVRLSCRGESVDETEIVVPEGGVANVVLSGRLAASRALSDVEPSDGTSDGLWLGVGLGVGGAILLAGGIALAVVLAQPSSPRGDFDPPTLTFGMAGSM